MFSVLKLNKWFSPCNNILHQSWHKVTAVSQHPNHAFSQLYYSVQVQNRIQDKLLSIKWNDGKVINYPYIYLRDHCPSPSCYNPQPGKRTLLNSFLKEYDKVTIKTAHINPDTDELHVEWINDD